MPQTQEDFESFSLLDNGDYDDSKGDQRRLADQPKPSTTSKAFMVGLVLFFIIDIVAFAAMARLLLKASSSVQNMSKMEFRDSYIGLNELYTYKKVRPSTYDTLINEPRLATQVSPADPNRVFPLDLHRWLSDFGLLTPPDRNLKVSKGLHTIAQFHVLDYGMERCALTVRLPSRGDSLPHPYILPNSGDSVRLNICQLDAPRPLDERTISWSTRPSCVRQLGILDAKIGGEVEMESFPCKSGSFLAYDVSCAEDSPECAVDVWSNHNATWGFFMKQYQTVI
ncbi:hypothetical protein B0H34DRAFT_4305 [Crassisporium funariophilum]|nr:hypothetical protein B0H34DRAFT_4305 [Crassisporium funariophilum]